MEGPTPNVNPEDSPDSEPEGDIAPEGAPEFGFTDDEIESMTEHADAALRAILGRC